MKVTISYQVDFKDIPRKVKRLISNLLMEDCVSVSNDLSNVGTYIDKRQYSEAIESVDIARQSLAKLDQSLLDYSNILIGYVKADADIKAGIAEQEIFNPGQTQEVPPENILDEKEEND
jgi:hypothetical protein